MHEKLMVDLSISCFRNNQSAMFHNRPMTDEEVEKTEIRKLFPMAMINP